MDSPVTVYHETSSTPATVKVKDNQLASRRSGRVHNIVKKHLQQKYLLCGFAIHAFIASPAYLYGIVVDSDREWVMRIWPALIYQAVGQISQSVLLHTADKCNNNHHHDHQKNENRKIILAATVIICLALTISGCLFSSAWIDVSTITQIIAIIIYGLLGGIGSSLIFSRTHLIIEAVRPKEDKYVRKTIHLCGEAFCQLFLSFVFTSLRTLYGTAQTLVLMASLLINLIPLSLLITKHREELLIRKLPTVTIPLLSGGGNNNNGSGSGINTIVDHRFDNMHSYVSRSNTNNVIDQIDGIEMQQKFWKNPLNIINNNMNNNELYSNYVNVDQDDVYMANINSNGVEIMDIIPEEDENISTIRSSTATIDNHSRISIEFGSTIINTNNINNNYYEEINKNHQCINNDIINPGSTQFRRIRKFSEDIKKQFCGNLMEIFVSPMRRAFLISKLYPATFLQSSDIFSYVMCLTVLPGLAVSHHQLKFAEIPFLFSLLAFPWMCFALMTPRFGNTLIKKKIKWHVSGCISKALALICISFSTSKLLLSVSSVLLGFGQAVSLFLQDLVIQHSMARTEWLQVKFPMFSINGLLVMVWGVLAHFTVTYYGFQASVGLAAFLYTSSIIIWFTLYFTIKN